MAKLQIKDNTGEDLLLNAIYPIGSIYLSVSTTEPSVLFGGTWEKVSQGRALFGSGTLEGNIYNANSNIEAGLPNIEGSMMVRGYQGAEGVASVINEASGAYTLSINAGEKFSSVTLSNTQRETDSVTFNASKSNSIYGKSLTVQPNAFVVNIWKRTA